MSPAKTFEAVLFPERFPVFKGLTDGNEFEEAWVNNRPWVFSNLAHAAYYNEEKLGRALAPFLGIESSAEVGHKQNPPLLRAYDVKGAQGFLAVWPDKAILSFRGTQPNEINDILAILMIIKGRFGSAQVHKGFLREINKLWKNRVLPDLEKYTSGIPVWATGHSLGAAMATIAGMRYEFEEIVTFGEPRVGINIDTEFKSKRHTRYVNGNDPVPKVPTETLLEYEHHGEEIKIHDPVGDPDVRYDHAIPYYSDNLVKENRQGNG